MILLMLMLLLRSSFGEESPKYPENTADISSINNLAYKPPIALDPKIRKALLNVLNRLEDEEKTEIDFKIESEKDDNPRPTQLPDDVKWEYKSNDTFKEFNYYEIQQDGDSSPPLSRTLLKNDKELIVDEPGALFFQVPDNNDDEPNSNEKGESLNLQETKGGFTPDLLFTSNLEKEPKREQNFVKAKSENSSTSKKSENSTTSKKSEITENDVEVFQAPLLTAFTLEQDERGLPKRIIPLDTAALSSILETNKIVSDSHEIRRAREQQNRGIDVAPFLPNEQQKRYQLELESQFQELQERKHQLELEKQRLYAEQENARRLKLALELKQREDFLRSFNPNEIPRQEVAFQKSIPLEIYNKPVIIQPLPVPQFSRLPQPPQPQIAFPDTVDRQLQSLFQRSGISQGKQHEDLNIVSKILALNHNENEKPRVTTERSNINTFRNENFRNKRKSAKNQASFN